MSDFLAEKGAENSPPLEGWQAKPDGVVIMRKLTRYMFQPYNPGLKQCARGLRRARNLAGVIQFLQNHPALVTTLSGFACHPSKGGELGK